jgi:hypothetical protein
MPGPTLSAFLTLPIRVRSRARSLSTADLALAPRVARALERAGLRRVGDLEGRRGQDLTWLSDMGSTQVRQLHRRLADADALEPAPLVAPVGAPVASAASRARTPTRKAIVRGDLPRRLPDAVDGSAVDLAAANPVLQELSRLKPNPLRRRLIAHVPPFPRIRRERIAIEQHARTIPLEALPMPHPLYKAVRRNGRSRLGDLHGLTYQEVSGRPGPNGPMRALYGLLRLASVVEPARLDGSAADALVQELSGLLPRVLRRRLLAHAPPFTHIRHEPIAIAERARSVPFEALPMPLPLLKAVRRNGRSRLGELHGLTYMEVNGRAAHNEPMRALYGLLHMLRAVEPTRLALDVPELVREVSVDDVPMSGPLRAALRARGVRRLGQLRSLTPARLGPKFGPKRLEDLRTLADRARSLRMATTPFARAIDEALERLPRPQRRALLLRFGAEGRPLTVKRVARVCRMKQASPRDAIDGWIRTLRLEAGIGAIRALRELGRQRVGKSRRVTVQQAEAMLRITRSRPRYAPEFYLRLAGSLEPRARVAVTWRKLR